MSWTSKPLWFEGMFVRPQHFQQHERYTESLIELRTGGLVPHAWGLRRLRIDRDLLALGKLSVPECRAVLPDGTPIELPESDDPPPEREIPASTYERRILLGLPVKRSNGVEVDSMGESSTILTRFRPEDYEARDTTSRTEQPVNIRIGKRNLRLIIEGEEQDEYVCLPIARIKEIRSDGAIVLSDTYMPPSLDCAAETALSTVLKEIEGLLRHRGESLAGRVDPSGRSGGGGIADFLMLELVNRFEPLFSHLANLAGLHPETAYRYSLMLAGELATFSSKRRRPPQFPVYKHDDLENCFAPVLTEIRQTLSMVIEDAAIQIPLQKRKYGVYVAPIADRSLLTASQFVFAASANMPAEAVRNSLPTQIKCGPVEDIRDLVNLQLPGIALKPMSVAPRQIPFHSGFTYFELDQSTDLWKKLSNSAAFAYHVSGDFPGLELEFWAIRDDKS